MSTVVFTCLDVCTLKSSKQHDAVFKVAQHSQNMQYDKKND